MGLAFSGASALSLEVNAQKTFLLRVSLLLSYEFIFLLVRNISYNLISIEVNSVNK